MASAVPANIECLVALFLTLLLSAPLRAETPEMPVAQLRVSSHLLTVEIAHTEATRSRGLMFRQSMDENRGMLFIFSQPGRHGMWMMNTDIPLSVAFVDEKGFILNIADMTPRTATAHRSVGVAKYAIETNLGWFAARNVKPGDRITGLEKLPRAE
jgi:uncharacterized protein